MIDFLRYRYICAGFSVVFFVAGVAAFIHRGGFNYHIDFVGGTELQVSFEKPIQTSQLRSALSEHKWQDPVIQSVGTESKQFLIRVKQEGKTLEDQFKVVAKDSFVENKVAVDHISWVGAEVGNDIKWDALISVLLSLLVILLYTALRSRYEFGIGAVAALGHDVLALLAFLLIFNEQVSLNFLAALLTTLGYSINDTIVIFSRIQENSKKLKGVSLDYIVNLSINETMRRTLLTSITTFLAVFSIYLIGGEALRGLSLSLLVGIVAGTYSSVYIASPVMLAFSRQKEDAPSA